MTAFPNSGRSDGWKTGILTGCFRPRADVGCCLYSGPVNAMSAPALRSSPSNYVAIGT